jgi:hypothetical protein
VSEHIIVDLGVKDVATKALVKGFVDDRVAGQIQYVISNRWPRIRSSMPTPRGSYFHLYGAPLARISHLHQLIAGRQFEHCSPRLKTKKILAAGGAIPLDLSPYLIETPAFSPLPDAHLPYQVT